MTIIRVWYKILRAIKTFVVNDNYEIIIHHENYNQLLQTKTQSRQYQKKISRLDTLNLKQISVWNIQFCSPFIRDWILNNMFMQADMQADR